jgi:hypothetical protein
VKAFVARSVVVLAIVSGFTVSAEAQSVAPPAQAVSISITSAHSAVGVLRS